MADPRLSSNVCKNCGDPIYRKVSTRWPWRHSGGGAIHCGGRGAVDGAKAKPRDLVTR